MGKKKSASLSAKEILKIDRMVDDLIDDGYNDTTDSVVSNILKVLNKEGGVEISFLSYPQPRDFDDIEDERFLIVEGDLPDGAETSIAELVDSFWNGPVTEQGPDAAPLKKKGALPGLSVLALPMFAGLNDDFAGIIGCAFADENGHEELLSQVASRVDTFLRAKKFAAERHTAMGLVNVALDRDGMQGISTALKILTRITGADKGAVIYLEEGPRPEIPAGERQVRLSYVENDAIIDKPDMEYRLNDRLGGSMIEYESSKIADSNYGMRALGILQLNPDTDEERMLNFHCVDLVNRYDESNHNVGKLFLIGENEFDRSQIDLMEAVGLQIDTKISSYHEQKRALSRSLHPDQIDFFLKYPKIARWFFENPREETIAMVFSDVCNYTGITREMGDPRATIEWVRRWILKAKALTLKHGGFFDKEVGDCAVSLFGPPFCAISLDKLTRVQNIDEIRELIRTSQAEPHVYAFHAVIYALESLDAISQFELKGRQLNLSIGIEVGSVAIGDLTGDIGKLTAMGDGMNMAARLQGYAGNGQLFIGPECLKMLDIYKRESYLNEFPFHIEERGEATLKGFDKPIPYYEVAKK